MIAVRKGGVGAGKYFRALNTVKAMIIVATVKNKAMSMLARRGLRIARALTNTNMRVYIVQERYWTSWSAFISLIPGLPPT
jgi:hypothetical protein